MNKKLNILLYIETSGPGGAETVLINIAKNLDRTKYNPVVVLHKSRWLHEQLQKLEIETIILPCQRSWDIGFLFRFIKLCRRKKIDVIHAHLFGASLYATLATIFLRIPVVATFHNEMFLPGRAERYLGLKNFLIRKLASKIVLVADYMKDEYLAIGKYPPGKMLTIYNGLSYDESSGEDLDRIRSELKINSDTPVIGHVANFRPPKGHLYLIEAARQVCGIFPQARFLLVGEQGDGTILSEVKNKITEYGLDNNVKLLGFRSDVSLLLRVMDIFVLSSISEGHPLSVVEAMMAARPVVATDVGGLAEIIDNGKTGYLVEPKNPNALAEKLLALLQDRSKAEQIGARGREIANERFSMKSMMQSYEHLYDQLAG